MCGINGVFSRKPGTDLISLASRMNALIQHRGPDDEGIVLFDDAKAYPKATPKSVTREDGINYLEYINEQSNETFGVFGHQRLSIIDLSALGHEPLADETGNYWLTYNGELYNYLEIRQELKELGVLFRSSTDAEVVLKAFIYWGKECVLKFNGMWAFSIYNLKKKEVFSSRDRFGVKPFYYTIDRENFAFSSEQKAIVMSGLIPRKINKKAAFDYLAFASLEQEPNGMFENIVELEPGYNLVFNYKTWTVKTEQFYNLKFNRRKESINSEKENTYIENISHLFKSAIDLRLRSDVSVGACLSGGIDSSAIVCQMADLGNTDMHTFTASSKDPEFDETKFANLVNQKIGAQSNLIYPKSEELLKDIEELIYAQDIPLFSTSTYAQFRVMKKVKETGIKVVLDGQGGDELFGGYLPYHINQWMDDLRSGNIIRLVRELKGFDSLSTGIQYFTKEYLKNYGIKEMPSVIYKRLIKKVQKEHQYISDDLMKNHGNLGYKKSRKRPPKSLNGILKHQFYNTRLKQYLKCEDRCSMWHSVEARVPFSDDINLIEYVFNIPGSYKIQKGNKKYLLKEATEHLLPEAIYNRKDKMGYVTPNNQWIFAIKDDLKKYFTPDLEEYFNYGALMKDYDEFFNQVTIPENQRMFKFIAFAVWKKTYGL
ncbi:MAG: asparagine synthase (glutamine-hydrolyzing) [Flavobacteriales bacterium]|nr:asparagine synthase (glutamine-hydrolyzing) [Flavobacteriales bacterium]